MPDKIATLLDCDTGRKIGCKSFCCRLLVRLEEHERKEVDPATNRLKGYIDKNENGLCIYQDEHNGLCKNWDNRPQICRQYDCNSDSMLQVVIHSTENNLGAWVLESVNKPISKQQHIAVPYIIDTKP